MCENFGNLERIRTQIGRTRGLKIVENVDSAGNTISYTVVTKEKRKPLLIGVQLEDICCIYNLVEPKRKERKKND